MRTLLRLETFALLGTLALGCGARAGMSHAGIGRSPRSAGAGSQDSALKAAPAGTPVKPAVYGYEIRNTYPHARDAFTQGLIFRDGQLWESTGRYDVSSLRKVDLKSGRVLKMIQVPPDVFAEGMTVFRGKVYQITWQNHKCFVYDPADFRKIGEFTYAGEGWGLTHDDSSLIMSDGTNTLRFIDPETFEVRRTVSVFEGGAPLKELNELEYVKGEIFANVWQTDRIVRIDPKTGRLTGTIDLSGLLPAKDRGEDTDVLNGIAYDESGDRLFVTGKLWPKLFEIRLVKKG